MLNLFFFHFCNLYFRLKVNIQQLIKEKQKKKQKETFQIFIKTLLTQNESQH